MGHDGLQTRTCRTPTAVIAELDGQLTTATVLSIEPTLAAILADPNRPLVIDLSNIPACDSAGASMLATATQVAHLADRGAGSLRLAAPTPPVLHALRTAGVLDTLVVFHTVDGAARGDPLDRLPHPPAPT